ncbi:MAG: EAL domain-containing protein [Pseudomonadota bacterium]
MVEAASFFSVWAQDCPYWILVEGPGAPSVAGLAPVYGKPDVGATKTGPDWVAQWEVMTAAIAEKPGAALGYRAAVLTGDALPALAEITAAMRPVAQVNAIARQLWLIADVNHGRLGCYLQPVIDRHGKRAGYEAFARMEGADGGVIGGGAIMQAAAVLQVEYALDRLLHQQAIASFAASGGQGAIFVNFLPGFVQRPEVYLDGLSAAVRAAKLAEGSVVLDLPRVADARERARLLPVAQYCREHGFLLALDDVASSDGLAATLAEIRPAYVKLDRGFAQGLNVARAQAMLEEVVRLAHENGAQVLAEGVETAAQHERYLAAEVDLFQGYLFGVPQRFPARG